jgi:mevalonate kinase
VLGECFDIPGKVFVLGEYAVLSGLPALAVGVAPRFSGSLCETEAEGCDYHLESPVGRLLRWAMERHGVSYSFHFDDPYQSGGFGASTAQFAIAYAAGAERLGLSRDWRSVWRFYRDLTVSDGIAPSGADLVAQLRGGVTLFDPTSLTSADLWARFDWSRLLIFAPDAQPDRKVATHAHLKALSGGREAEWRARLFSRLERPLMRGLFAIARRDVRSLGQAMNDYADVLADSCLEMQRTLEDRRALAELPGVYGAKGSGALQADVVLALIAPDADAEPIIQSARARGLNPICQGLTRQAGISRRDWIRATL